MKKQLSFLTVLNQDKYRVQIADIYLKIESIKNYENASVTFKQHCFDFAWLGGILKECFEKFSLEKEAYDIIKMVAYFREFIADSKDANYYNFYVQRIFLIMQN